jgi:hypothetical protein
MRAFGALEGCLRLSVEDIKNLGVFPTVIGSPAFHTLLVLNTIWGLRVARHSHVNFTADVRMESVHQKLECLRGISLATELNFINAATLGISNKGANKVRWDYYMSRARIGCLRPDGFHEGTRLIGKGIAPLLGSTVGGPIGSLEEFCKGANISEGLES